VDDLVSKLEGKGYNVWLDYRVLIPGIPWKEQIDKGLHEADTVLLVVSKASLSSQYVALEWMHFLKTNKRVILLIFEAVDLPPELEKYEWIDFRGSYKAGLDELFSQLENPIQEEHPVPETGFKAPAIVWGTIALSAVVALLSLTTLWTLFIPWFLVPLPYKIYKRSFDFTRVQASLLAMPVAIALSALVYYDTAIEEAVVIAVGLGIWAWILLAILRSPGMQRWGKPEATVPKFANPYKPNIMNPEPVPFFVDHAHQDRIVAQDLTNTLKKYGHPLTETAQSALAVFALISRFKSDTEADPDKQMVFPVMIQGNNDISQKLSKNQWIDFRPGVRGLNAIAQLLPNPRELLKSLGMRPVSSQSVFPPMITGLYYFIFLMTVINVGAVIDYLFFSGILDFVPDDLYGIAVAGLAGGAILYCILAYFMIRNILERKGLFSKFPFVLAGIVALGLLMYAQIEFDAYILEPAFEAGFSEDEIALSFTLFGNEIYFIGLAALLFTYFRNRLDIRRWFPAKK
jgi:hypothetical protein